MQDNEMESDNSDDDVPLNNLIRKKQADPKTNEKCWYDEYVMKRNDELAQSLKEVATKKGTHGKMVVPKSSEHEQPVLADDNSEAASKRTHGKTAAHKSSEHEQAVLTDDNSEAATKRTRGETAALKSSEHEQPVLADENSEEFIKPINPDLDDDADDLILAVMAENEMYNQSGMWQISEDVRIIKDWVESLNRKSDMLHSIMNAMEARLAAIEAGISLVPLSLHHEACSQTPSHHSQNQSLGPPVTAITASTSTSPANGTSASQCVALPVSSPQLESFTPPSNIQSTPITPTHHPRPFTSISPIVSSLPSEKAIKLKACRAKATSRKQFTRKCMAELFSKEELSTSNISGSRGKEKLDECKIALVNHK